MTTQPDESTPASFGLAYTLIVWSTVAFMVLVLAWVLWTMFNNTSAGTTRAQALEIVRPTQTAVAMAYLGDGAAPAAVAVPPICTSCHMIGGSGGQVAPDLSTIGTVAAERIADPSYTGSATTPEEYIVESVQSPSVFLVPNAPGKVYSTAGTSVMPVGLEAQVDDLEALAAYLATLQ